MSNPVYFFDTYAFFEVLRANPNYKKFENMQAITTIFNLAELNYNLKKEKSKAEADEYTERYKEFLVPVTLDDIKAAMDLKMTKKDLSIPDVIGYTIAKKYGVKFLTGDTGFNGRDNVELVK